MNEKCWYPKRKSRFKEALYIDLRTPVAGHLFPESHFESLSMPMMCYLILHSFLPVFTMVGIIAVDHSIEFDFHRSSRLPNHAGQITNKEGTEFCC